MNDGGSADSVEPLCLRRDIPIAAMHHLNGHTRRKNGNRAVVGRTNRSVTPTAADSRHVELAWVQPHEMPSRASSSMSQRRFLSSTLNGFGSERAFAPGTGSAVLRSDIAGAADALPRSLTPDAFWFGTPHVGTQVAARAIRCAKAPASTGGCGGREEGRVGPRVGLTPPPLLAPSEMLAAVERRRHEAAERGGIPVGLGGAIPAADGSTCESLPPHREMYCEVPRQLRLAHELLSLPRGRAVTAAHHTEISRSEASSSALRATHGDQFMHFFRSKSGLDNPSGRAAACSASSLPQIDVIRPQTRTERTKFPDTRPHTQAHSGCGTYSTEAARFDSSSRGLSLAAAMHEDKLRSQARFEVRAKRHVSNARRVADACLADDQRLELKKESRILHKAELMRQLKRHFNEAEKRSAHDGRSPATTLDR